MERKLLQYASLFEHNPDAVTSVDLDGKFTSINKAGQELFGYTVEELLNMSLWDVLPQEFVAREKASLLRNIRNGRPGYSALQLLHKQGFYLEVNVTTFPILVDNKIAGQYAITKNLTELKQTKEALQRMKEEFREAVRQQLGLTFKFKKIGDKFIHTLCDGELVYLLGRSPQDIIGKDIYELLPPEVARLRAYYYQRAWNGERVSYEGVSANGTAHFTSLRPIFRGREVVEVIGSCIDITERKRIEKALRQTEENYRLIAENASDLIRVLDTNGVIQYASPSHKTILGYPPESLVGKSTFSLLQPEERDKAQRDFFQMIELKRKLQREYQYPAKNGEKLLFEVNVMPVLGEDAEVERIVVVARDITERKRAENLLRNSDKLSVIGELAAGIAHEIRNPLTALKGFIQFLRSKEENKPYLEVMLSEVERINAITSELLLLAKPQAIAYKQSDLGQLLQSVITLLEAQASLTNVQFELELDDQLPEIVCEEKQLKQVFINIIKNGIEAMPKGGVIKIEARCLNPSHVLIRFTDNGHGIPREMIPKLGEPFYSTKEKGTGLGLMVSYKIIKAHRGSISFQSELNQGTTVEILLPL